MKKFVVSLIALAAISTASFASQRGYDLRDSDTYFGKYSTQLKNKSYSNANSAAFAVVDDSAALTAFERMRKISEENDHGRH